jgi:lycopene cyclase domain-containing protein
MSLYLLLNIGSLIIPLLYSFEPRMRFITRWKAVFSGIFMTAIVFIVWDIIFTKLGVWRFNPRYHSGIEFFDLPIEEWLFFICIPYSSLFIHFAFHYFCPNTFLRNKTLKIIYLTLILILIPVLFYNTARLYTTINYSLWVLLLTISYFKFKEILSTFFITFLIILIPFGLVNGILTGSFIDEPVVIYNNAENLGIRLGTIPIEDIGYAFNMLIMSLIFIKLIETKTQKTQN